MYDVEFQFGQTTDSHYVTNCKGMWYDGKLYCNIEGDVFDVDFYLKGRSFGAWRAKRLSMEEVQALDLRLPVNNWERRQAA